MNQRLQDLATLLRKDRKTQVIAGAIVVGLAFLVFADPKKPVAQAKRDYNLKAGSGAGTTDERYSDLLTRFNSQLSDISQQTHDTSQALEQQRLKSEEFEKRTAEVFKRMLERMSEQEVQLTQNSMGSGINGGDGSGTGSILGAGLGGGADGVGGGGIAGSGAGADGSGTGGPGSAGRAGSGSLGGAGAYGSGGLGGMNGGPGGLSGSGAMGRGGAQAVNVSMNGGAGANDFGGEPDGQEPFGFETQQVAPPPAPPVKRAAVVGEGDSVRVQVIQGVNAPTDGTPYPVVLKLIGDVQGPDGSTLPLGEARVIAAVQGSLTDSRALFRLSSLNLRLPNGRRKIVDVDGYLVGEDGKLGLEGMLIDPLSSILGAVAIAGGVEGTGQAFAARETTQYTNAFGGTNTAVTGDVFKYGLGKGTQNASREWSSIIKERAREMVPHVEVLSGRTATAVFSKSFVIPDLYEALENSSDEDGSL